MMDRATRRRLERAERATLPADPGPEPPYEDHNAWMVWMLKQTPGGLPALFGKLDPLPMGYAEHAAQEALVTTVPLAPEAKPETTKAVAVQPPTPPAPEPPAEPAAPKQWYEEYIEWRFREAKDFAEEAEAEAEALREDDDPLGLYEDE